MTLDLATRRMHNRDWFAAMMLDEHEADGMVCGISGGGFPDALRAVLTVFDEVPRVAMLSFSNFGSVKSASAERVRRAVELVRTWRPDLEIEGEMHADAAIHYEATKEHHPFSRLTGGANVLVFPSLDAGNIAHKIAQSAGAEACVGPILLGLDKPVNILSPYSGVRDIVISTAITAMMCSARASESPDARGDVDVMRIARLLESTEKEMTRGGRG